MDCELCLEEFNVDKNSPKVLSACGHTFCNKCLLKIWTNGSITCPVCRQKSRIFSVKDLPQTNYSLIKLKDLLSAEDKAKQMLGRYRMYAPYRFTNVSEYIMGGTDDGGQEIKKLKLYSINDDEFKYKLYRPTKSNIECSTPKYNPDPKYSFSKHSIWTWLFISPEYRFFWFLSRKFTRCRHKHGCLEHLIRKVFSSLLFYALLRGPVTCIAKKISNSLELDTANSFSLAENLPSDYASGLVVYGLELACVSFISALGSIGCYYRYSIEK